MMNTLTQTIDNNACLTREVRNSQRSLLVKPNLFEVLASYFPIALFVFGIALIGIYRISSLNTGSFAVDLKKPSLILEHPFEKDFHQYIQYNSNIVIVTPIDFEKRKYIVGDCVWLELDSEEVGGAMAMARRLVRRDRVDVIEECSSEVLRTVSRLREKLIERYREYMRYPYSAIVLGTTIGLKDEFTDDFNRAIRVSGLSHIFVVSGFNFSLINSLLRRLLSQFGRLPFFVISVFVLGLYFIICGYNPPALRAILLSFLSMVALVVGYQFSMFYGLILSYIVMIIISPPLATDISFNLSFAASFGLFFSSLLADITTSNWLSSMVSNLLINCFVFPIILFYFGEYSLIGVVANFIVIDFISFFTVVNLINIVTLDTLTQYVSISISWLIVAVVTYTGTVVEKYDWTIFRYSPTVLELISWYGFLVSVILLFTIYRWRLRVH